MPREATLTLHGSYPELHRLSGRSETWRRTLPKDSLAPSPLVDNRNNLAVFFSGRSHIGKDRATESLTFVTLWESFQFCSCHKFVVSFSATLRLSYYGEPENVAASIADEHSLRTIVHTSFPNMFAQEMEMSPANTTQEDAFRIRDLATAAEKEHQALSLHNQAFALSEAALKLRQKHDPRSLTETHDVINGRLVRKIVSQAAKRRHVSRAPTNYAAKDIGY